MFSKKDLEQLNIAGFELLHADKNRITFRSRVGHEWHLIARTVNGYDTCEVYHRHSESDPWHIQERAKGFQTALQDIRKHDEYQERKDRIRDKRRELAKKRRGLA